MIDQPQNQIKSNKIKNGLVDNSWSFVPEINYLKLNLILRNIYQHIFSRQMKIAQEINYK